MPAPRPTPAYASHLEQELYRMIRQLPSIVEATCPHQLTGAAICVLSSNGEVSLATANGQVLVPSAMMLTAAMVKALLADDQDPRMQDVLGRANELLDHAISLKRMDTPTTRNLQ